MHSSSSTPDPDNGIRSTGSTDQPATDRTGNSTDSENGGQPSQVRQEPFPPQLSWNELLLLIVCCVILLIALLYLADQVCFAMVTAPNMCESSIALALFAIGFIGQHVVRHKLIAHKLRREDLSEVEALLVEADTVEARLTKPAERPEGMKRKKGFVEQEAARLRKEVSNRAWTEYQILPLNQLLVDFLKVDDLVARARLTLADLNDYAEDSSFRYDRHQYYTWENRIDEAVAKIDQVERPHDEAPSVPPEKSPTDRTDVESARGIAKDDAAEPLRAELRSLLEHVASYRMSWAEGSAILRGLLVCGLTSIIVFLAMGLLPLYHPAGDDSLNLFHWAVLGGVGSLAALLLEFRKSDAVEVGNTEGKKELWRAILGTALGLLAGVLIYAIVSGELLSGTAVPTIEAQTARDVGLSIVWAVAAGFSFETIFDRIRSTTEGHLR